MKKYLKAIEIGLGIIIMGFVGFIIIRGDVCYYDGHIWADTGICSKEVVEDDDSELPKGVVFDNKLKLVEFKGKCDSEGPVDKSKILKRHFVSSDVMKIKVQTQVTCCVDFRGAVKSGRDIIDLRFVETGEPCWCLCKGVLDYKIKGVDKRKYRFYLNGKLIK